MKQLLFFISLITLTFSGFYASATHLKAGDMTADHVAGYTWRFTLTVFTYKHAVDSNHPLDLQKAEISVNGVLVDSVDRVSRTQIDEDTYKNLFVFEYTFSGPKVYVISFSEEDRNDGILNINNGSSQVPFYIETYLLVSPLAATDNNTPDLYVPPIDEAAVNEVYIHNPGAHDFEGDSLSYELVVPQVASNDDVPEYYYPEGLTLNPVTGDLIWDSPKEKGLYNVAFIIEEWRDGMRIGYVLRDMQIEVKDSENEPPVITIPPDTCIVANSLYRDSVSATDPDGDQINLYAYGGAFDVPGPQPVFNPVQPNPQDTPAVGIFEWQPNCMQVRSEPYQIVFKAEDVPGNDNPLTDLKTLSIKVLAPPVDGISAVGGGGQIELNWTPYTCGNAEVIEIYRSSCDSLPYDPAPCEEDVPKINGFEKIAEVSASVTSYIDNDDGEGLKQGSYYCYLLKVNFGGIRKGSSAYSSQVCAVTNQHAPLPLRASVISTDSVNGKVEVSWSRPLDFDSSKYISPYKYTLKRGVGVDPETYETILTLTDLQDTTIIDSLINTHQPCSYIIEFSDSQGFLASANSASTVNLKVRPGSGKAFLNWGYNTPWDNSGNEGLVYRKLKEDSVFKLISRVAVSESGSTFNDNNLNPEDTVCYYVETMGEYCLEQLPDSIINYSQEVCVVPVDSSAPCPPELFIDPLRCGPVEDGSNVLSWIPETDEPCNIDIDGYKLYFAEREGQNPDALLTNTPDTTFTHINSESLAGCYEVSAYNTFGVESERSNRVCTDICVDYQLPNLITPNNDSRNDYFRPLKEPVNVESVEFSVYNRWGSLVFSKSGDPLIKWRGISGNGETVPDGVYYYNVEVKFKRRLKENDDFREMKGWIQVVSEDEGGGL